MRRHLPIVLALVLVAATFAASVARGETADAFTLHEVAPGVWAAIVNQGTGAGGNSGFVIGDDGVAVVDTFQTADAAKQLLDAIRDRTELPVRFAVNTHYHLDHVAGNGVLHEAGATIVAHRNVRAWERTENLKFFGENVPPERRAWVESLVLPEIVYEGSIELHLGSRRLVVESMPGHTGGDSIVFVPDADVVFTGDLFWNHDLPNTIDADTEAWIATDRALASAHQDATFVPGHGEVGTARDLAAFGGYLEALRGVVAAARERGLEGDDLVSAAHETLAATYRTWGIFDRFVDANVRQMVEELAGTKRRPGS